ncbi:MAG: NUDIX domain-containing protein [Bacteroidota bacterium]|nr:NUDIX domain-containing protein [Bacteroidota bacterium]
MIAHKIVPNVSVDCVIFGFDFERLNVLLVERELKDKVTNQLLINDHTLAGYHIYEDEDLDSAAARILRDLSGLDNIYLQQFYAFGSTRRVAAAKDQLWLRHINRGFSDRILTVGYFSLIDNTKVTLTHKEKKLQWFPVDAVADMEMAFDHKEIFYKGLEALRNTVKIEPIAFELLPERFTLTQLQKLYESLFGSTFDKRNFRKKISQMHYIIPLREKEKGVAHKPAQLFLFSREVYEKTRKEKTVFLI